MAVTARELLHRRVEGHLEERLVVRIGAGVVHEQTDLEIAAAPYEATELDVFELHLLPNGADSAGGGVSPGGCWR